MISLTSISHMACYAYCFSSTYHNAYCSISLHFHHILSKYYLFQHQADITAYFSSTCDVREQFNDLVTVYNGAQTDAPVISRYCGRHDQQEVMSTSRTMRVTFTSNSFANMQGFAAIFKFVKYSKGNLLQKLKWIFLLLVFISVIK